LLADPASDGADHTSKVYLELLGNAFA